MTPTNGQIVAVLVGYSVYLWAVQDFLGVLGWSMGVYPHLLTVVLVALVMLAPFPLLGVLGGALADWERAKQQRALELDRDLEAFLDRHR